MEKTKREKIKRFFDCVFITLIVLGLFSIWRNILVVVPLVYALTALELGSERLTLFLPRFMMVWLTTNLLLMFGILGYCINHLLNKKKIKK